MAKTQRKAAKKTATRSAKAARPAAKPVKKAPAQKAAAKKVKAKKPAKKPVKPVAKKTAVKKAPVRPAAKKAPARAVSVKTPKPSPRERVARSEPEKKAVKPRQWSADELAKFRVMLQTLRDRVVDEINFLAGDNLNRSQRESSGDLSSYSFHMADQGTDNFDREFALNLVSSEQDALYEIDEALQRIDQGEYGVCEACGCAIEKPRLKALPFCRMCVRCKAESERGRTRYRPFSAPMSTSQD